MPNANEPIAGDTLDAIIADHLQQVRAGNVPARKLLLCSRVPKDGQAESGILTRSWLFFTNSFFAGLTHSSSGFTRFVG
jgi:hypothetical protein